MLTRATPEQLETLHQLLLDWIELAAIETSDEPQALSGSALIVFHQSEWSEKEESC